MLSGKTVWRKHGGHYQLGIGGHHNVFAGDHEELGGHARYVFHIRRVLCVGYRVRVVFRAGNEEQIVDRDTKLVGQQRPAERFGPVNRRGSRRRRNKSMAFSF